MAIIDTRNVSGVGMLLETLMNKERLAQAEEQLKLQKSRFKLEQEQFQFNQGIERAKQEGAIIGARAIQQRYGELGQFLGGASPQALPYAIQALQGFRGGEAEVRAGEAGATTAESTARTTTGTEADRLAQSGQQTEMNRLAIDGAALNNALTRARVANDPQRVNGAWQMMVQGAGVVPAGMAAAAWGLDPNWLPSNFMLPPIGAMEGGAGGEAARKGASLYGAMTAANGTINQLYDKGVELGFMGSWHRSSKNWLSSWVSGVGVNDEERKLIQAQKAFADSYRFFISGQQSSDAEAERLLFTMLENPGDGAQTIAQKRFMRDQVISMAESVARGALNAGQAADRIVAAAKNRGLPPEQIAVFEQQAADAWAYTEAGGWRSNTTFTPSVGGAQAGVDGVLGGLGVTVGGR